MQKKKPLLLVLATIWSCLPMLGETVYYTHPDLRLHFRLNTETKEASLGNGIDSNDQNAIALPPIGDPWWDESPSTNYWKDLDIPATIVCQGTAYTRDGGTLTIPQDTYTITAISDKAFYKSTRLQTIKLPETIKEIGSEAFYYCIYLKSINIPSQVSSIGYGTFVWCNKLESIHLPATISSIGSSAFSDCISLKEINIPGNCQSIGDEAFKWCTSLSTLTIEDGTAPLSVGACYALGLNYEGQMPRRWRGMFADCPLKNLYLGRDIVFFSAYVNGWYPPFMGYHYLGKGTDGKDIVLDEGKVFNEVVIGDLVTNIPASMFKYATIPNAITMPSHLKSIGDEAFANRSGTGGTLRQGNLSFPETLEAIGKDAFLNCTSLGSFTFEGTTPPAIDGHPFQSDVLVFVPAGARDAYRYAENWDYYRIVEASEEVVTINVKTAGTLLDRLLAQGYQLGTITRLQLKGTLNEDDWANVKKMSVLYDLDISDIDLEEIGISQFEKSTLAYIKLPKTLKSIGENAFYQCKNLSGVLEIPPLCTEIGKQAFRETGISGLSYEKSLKIGDFAFDGCTNLLEVYIKGKGTVAGRMSFASCGLKKVIIGSGVSINEDVFALCDNLTEAVFEDGVKYVGDYALNTKNLSKLYFEGTIKELGTSVFRNEYIKEVYISDIGKWCQFQFPVKGHPLLGSNDKKLYLNGEELVNVVIPDNVNTIADYAFYQQKKLESIQFGGELESIGCYAFDGCNLLRDFQLPEKLKSIAEYAFRNCSSLTNLDLPESLESIGNYAFSGCSNLERVTAHWNAPISISRYTFQNVSQDCCVFVPIGTATKYSNAGWSYIPNMSAMGVLSVIANQGGNVSCAGEVVSDATTNILFQPYKTFTIGIEPQNGFRIFKVKLDGNSVPLDIAKEGITIEEPEEDHSLIVLFGKEGVELGDADGNNTVDEDDAMAIANYLINSGPSTIQKYASDINDDGIINVTDIIVLISKISNK